MRNRIAKKILKILVILPLACAIVGFVVMSLWNWLLPPLVGLHPVTFWQALGLFVLARILLGGFHGHGGHHHRWHRRMRERWEKMTPEERERFRKGMRPCGRSETTPAA